ncbi:MAG TPA: tetratricopeptide repeat protein, partial [Burkholderiales bacterium]|nr:tetratricopeptide repeat protein [Burkholderiales bacterium]
AGLRVLRLLAGVLLGLAALTGPAPAQERPDLARAQALMNEGKAAEAFALLEPFEDRMAGNVEFDYLLGISALDAGRADRATLAFERVLAVNPNFAGARLDLGRAYFAMGDLARAREELNAVRRLDPPEAAQRTIARYLEAIDAAERARLRRFNVYAELTFGYDWNVNNSTSQNIVFIPALGNLGFTLAPTNVQQEDAFRVLGAGGEYGLRVDPNAELFAGADWRQRAHEDLDSFDLQSLDYRLGFALGRPERQIRVMGYGGRHELDQRLNREITGASAELRLQAGPLTQISPFGGYTQVRFRDPGLVPNNFNARTLGVGVLRLSPDGRAALFGSLFGGREVDTDGRADGNKDFRGLRLGGQYGLRGDLDAFFVLAAQTGHYSRTNAAFLTQRKDDLVDSSVGLAWRFARGWTLRPAAVASRNASNIPLYSYRRAEMSLTLRYDLAL